MRKPQSGVSQENVWDDNALESADPTAKEIFDVAEKIASVEPKPMAGSISGEYDLEGLMTDFPTARELERFVFDETGIVLNLKGRANKLKYQIAMDVLNGVEVDPKYTGGENPYVDKSDMVPIDPIREPPPRDPLIPDHSQIQNTFYTPIVPHPDPEWRAMDRKVQVMFRKYNNGLISYEIMGPLEQKPTGEKIDKYGRIRPEVIKWVDPRTGEQIAVRTDGTLTPQGKRLRAMMQTGKFRVNKSNQWDIWVDREFATITDSAAHNPWRIDQ